MEKQNNKLQEEKKGNEKEIRIEEHIPIDIIEKIPQITNAIGIIQKMQEQQEWNGPLPPQVFKDISPEDKSKFIDSLINSANQDNEIQKLMIQTSIEDRKDIRKLIFRVILIISISVLIFIGLLVLTGNAQILKEIIPYVFTALFGGAGGYGIGISKNKSEEENK